MNEMHLLNIANADALKALPFHIQVAVVFAICSEESKGWCSVPDGFIHAIRDIVERMRSAKEPQFRFSIKFIEACLEFRKRLDELQQEQNNEDKPFYQDPSTN